MVPSINQPGQTAGSSQPEEPTDALTDLVRGVSGIFLYSRNRANSIKTS